MVFHHQFEKYAQSSNWIISPDAGEHKNVSKKNLGKYSVRPIRSKWDCSCKTQKKEEVQDCLRNQ